MRDTDGYHGITEWKGTSTGFLDHRLFHNGRNFPLCMFLIAVEGSLFYLVNNIYVRERLETFTSIYDADQMSALQAAEVVAVWGQPGNLATTARITPFYLAGILACPLSAMCACSRSVH